MLCNKCGMQNPEGSAFCVSCGAPLDATEQSQQNTDFAQQYQEPVQQPVQQKDYSQEFQPPVQQYQLPEDEGYLDFTSEFQPPVQQYQLPVQPYQQQDNYAPVRGPRLDDPDSVRSAKIWNIIAGVIACLCFILPFLPSFTILGRSFNVFNIGNIASDIGNYSGEKSISAIGAVFIALFVIPMVLQIPWAILSFMRKSPAGIFGLISSIIFFIVSWFWLIVCIAVYVYYSNASSFLGSSFFGSGYSSYSYSTSAFPVIPILMAIISQAAVEISVL